MARVELESHREKKPKRLDPFAILSFAMAIAIVVNLVQFPRIEARTTHNLQAVHTYPTGDLFDIAIERHDSARLRVAPYYYLGRLAPGSVLVMPARGVDIWFPMVETSLAFGRAAEIRRVRFDPVNLVDLEQLEEFRVPTESFAPSSGRTIRLIDQRVGYYFAEPRSEVLVVVTPEGPPQRTRFVAFVDLALLDAEVRAALEGQ